MTDKDQEFDALHDLQGQAGAIEDLLAARGAFEQAYAAFRAESPEKFQAVLAKAKLQIHCERICHWIRTKECVFLCLDLAGPPVAFERAPDPRVLAKAIAKLGEDDRLLQRVAEILVKRDKRGFAEVLDKLGLVQHAHLFCHWLCAIRYRLVCRWICQVERFEPPVLWREIKFAAQAIGALAKDEAAFKAAAAASAAGDSVKLAGAVRQAGLLIRCHWVCEFFCSWRCVLACLHLSRRFPFQPIEGAAQIKEAREFAAISVRLAQDPGSLMQLSAAVGAGDAEKWAVLLKKFKLERFAFQLCHWICGWRCYRFCHRVCIDIDYHPWFTHIGHFTITGDISPATGLTNGPKLGHGGPNYGFRGGLSLRGFCPKYDPAHPAERMAYRFLFHPAGAPAPVPITGGFVHEVSVGTRKALWNGNWEQQDVIIRGAGGTSPTPPVPGPGLFPPPHFIEPDAKGWVTVDLDAADAAFNGYLMGFASAVAIPGGPAATTVAAGTAVPAAEQKNGADCAIIYQATRTGTIAAVNGGAAPDYTNMVGKVRINNWNEVALLDLLQFHSGGGTSCSPLSSALDIEYTVDHELIAAWSVGLSSASGMTLTSPPPPPQTARGGAGTHHENISAWPTCSYTVTLSTRMRLTDGIVDDSGRTLPKTFCIGRR